MVTNDAHQHAHQLAEQWSGRATVRSDDGCVRLRWVGGEELVMRPSAGLLNLEVRVPPGENIEDFIELISRTLTRQARVEDAIVWV